MAKLKDGGYGVYASTGQGTPKTIVSTATHPQFNRFRSASISNTGAIAFAGFLTSGGANLFVADATSIKTVITGDMFGSVINGFYADLTARALNDMGQVVFYYRLANGRSGIAVATPSNGVESKTLGNISTRLPVLTGDRALIGGFIVTGTAPKSVIIRGLGPSLAEAGLKGLLADPLLQLFSGNGTLLTTNNNWKDSQQAEIQATGVAPRNDFESAILRTLAPGSYTAVLRGVNNGTGIGVVEAYDLNQTSGSTLANISSRGFVSTGDNVLIAGFIVGPYTRTVVRAIGPSLNGVVAGALQDPTVDIVDGNGATTRSNDNWKSSQRAKLEAIGIQPSHDNESAIVATLPSGNYTAVVRGKNNTTGIAVVEVYNLK